MNKLKCILLIDDDPATNYVHERIIKRAEITEDVRSITSAREALNFLTSKNDLGDFPQPDIIFLDINMPGMSGWEFLDEYDKLPADNKAQFVLVMLTTSLNPDDRKEAEARSLISDFVNKPLDANKLQFILERFFPNRFTD